MVKLSSLVCVRLLVIFLAAILDYGNCQGVAIRHGQSAKHPRLPFRLRKRFLRDQENDNVNVISKITTNFSQGTTESNFHTSTVRKPYPSAEKDSNSSTENAATGGNVSAKFLDGLFSIDQNDKSGQVRQSSYIRRKRRIDNDEAIDKSVVGRQSIYDETLLDLDSPSNDLNPLFSEDFEGKPHVRVKRENALNSRYSNNLANFGPQVFPTSGYVPSVFKMENNATNDPPASDESKAFPKQEGNKENQTGDGIGRSEGLKNNENVLSTWSKNSMDDSLTGKIDLDDVYPEILNPPQDSTATKLIRQKRYDYAEIYPEFQSNEESKLINDFPQQKLFRRSSADYTDYYAEKQNLRFNRPMSLDNSYSEDMEDDNNLYMDLEDQPNSNAYEIQQSPKLERKKRHNNINGYGDPNFIDGRSNRNNHPLMENGQDLIGETARFRRKVPGSLSGRRALRKARSKKRGRKKHKRRKGNSSKRTRKNVQERRMERDGERIFMGNRETRLGWPKVVDEMQVESRIEKRDSNDGKSEVDVAKREIKDNNFMFPGKEYRRLKKNTANSRSDIVREKDSPEMRHFEVKRESLRKKSIAKRMSVESLKEKREDVEEKPTENKETMEGNDISEKKEGDEGSMEYEKRSEDELSSPKDEDEAALLLERRIKRLIDAYANPAQSNARNEAVMEESENDEDLLRSRVKRHESLPEKRARNNVDESPELKYYESVREPEDTALEGPVRNENFAAGGFRGDRAVRSIEEIKVLAEKLVNKVNDLQSYVNEADDGPSGRKSRKMRMQPRETGACYANLMKIVMSTTEGSPKLAERCVPPGKIEKSSKVKPKNLKEKSRDSGENTAALTKAGNAAYAEEERVKGAKTMVDHEKNRRKRKSRKWDRWTDWSSCSVTCGKGRQIRWRHCIRDCDTAETEMEEKACQLPACPPGKFLGIFR